jgi:hypothetical protein
VAWRDDVLEILGRLPNNFSLAEIYRFVPFLVAKHPANENIEAKIRQQLQVLRDEGGLQFRGDGSYVQSGAEQTTDFLPLTVGEETTRLELSKLLNQEGPAALNRGMFKPARGAYRNHMFLFHNEAENPYGDVHEGESIQYIGQGMQGNQELKGFNKTLASHLDEGIQVHYFVQPKESPGKIRYVGQVFVDDYDEVFRPTEGRSVWQFKLLPSKDTSPAALLDYGRTMEQASDYARPAGPVEHALAAGIVTRKLRDRAFQRRVLLAYQERCAVCGTPLKKGKISELQGAHIWAVASGGPHEIRNGMALCVRHHWAFDHGFFTLTKSHALEWLAPSPDPHEEAKDGAQLVVPGGIHAPHLTYINWHRQNWGSLALT